MFDLCGMCFKGGTALRKFRIGHLGRFSFDLDFNVAPGCADDAVELIADTAANIPTDDFAFTVTERRGHHGLAIETPLMGGVLEAKMDFSERPVILPTQALLPVRTPLQQTYPFEVDQRIPLMHLDENVAEKLSRWQSRPLVRDLYDLARVGREVGNIGRLAELYVLKSHVNWSQSPPNRRSQQPARALGEFTRSLDVAVFESGDLVAPTLAGDRDRTAAIRHDLELVAHLARQCDEATTPELWEIAHDNGKLAWIVEQRAARLRTLELDRQQDVLRPNEPSPDTPPLDRSAAGAGSQGNAVCAAEMPRVKKRCVLPDGHSGGHRSVL